MHEHLKQFLQFLRLNRNASPHTVRAYESDLSQFIAHAAAGAGLKRSELTPAQLDRAAIRRFLAELHAQGQTRASAARKLAAARTFLRYLRREGIIDDDPGALVATPKRDIRMPAHLSEQEIVALIAAAPDTTPLGRRDRAILELFYASGLRLSELVGLDLDDVNLSGRMSRVRGKGGKQRLVPIGRPAVIALEAYLVRGRPELARRGRGTPAIFLNARGGRLSRQSAWQVLQDAAERAGINAAVSPHVLRHSFATHLLDGGADVRVVQELLGHASVTTTQIYTMVTVHALREVWAGAHPRAR